jgi:hypothetical protein
MKILLLVEGFTNTLLVLPGLDAKARRNSGG